MANDPETGSDDQPTIPPTDRHAEDATIAPKQTEPSPGSPLPKLDGFQLLEELGRGGMGVVYKARNTKLDRTVALKMILAGQFASEEQVKRFQIEAETAAKLDHPGIVPIFDFGQSQGVHFFSMKLIDGKSLAEQLETYQSDPRKSAELMIKIARAVHHAHERGVLHRDLKPANILIDSVGQPAITDLGLAKQLDDDSGLTQTGLVMGSPGFMSPEQAAGKSDVTTSADVYALGAVLYWMITGRPPFQGQTNLDVILQTIDKQPESLQTYQPSADRDLNLICQKALNKSPAERYLSAAALADDLQAWLDGDALSVKSPSPVKLAQIWIRKNFRTLAISMSAGLLCGFIVGLIILMILVDGQLRFTEYSYSQLGESTQPWLMRYFTWVEAIPRGLLLALPTTITWLTVGIGIWMIGVIRPRSREVGMVAAITASMLAGIVAFVMSLGWAPIIDHSIGKGRNDIQLISDSFWMEDPAERALAKEAMTQRYPGVVNVAPKEKGNLIYRKILNDQALGIPKGMWVGIGTTLCLTVLPLFCSAMFAGLIWQNGDRGWSFIGKSIELGIYSALAFLVITKSVSGAIGTSPGPGFQLLTLAGLGIALYWGLKDAKVGWRISGFMLANVVMFLNFAESSHIDNAARRARLAKTDQELATAAHYFEKKVSNSNDQYDRFQLAIIYAYLNDDVKYANQCRSLMANFQNMYRPDVAERIAKVCFLHPELVPNQQKAHKFAELSSGFDSSVVREYLYFCRALSEMRQGHLQKTLHWNQRSRDAISSENRSNRAYLEASSHVVDALALQAASRRAEAETALKMATDLIQPDTPDSWQSRLIYQTLLREAGERTQE